jgi:site-specific DNA-methyltransferase (adenine-specific)
LQKTDLFLSPSSVVARAIGRKGYLTREDALTFIRSLKPAIADIVFLDPPFNLGKNYHVASSLETGKADIYQTYMEDLIRETVRILRPGGALFFYHLPYWASRFSQELHKRLRFRHWIAISMKNGFARGKYLYPAHYALLYFVKGQPARFRRPKISPRYCRHCDELVKDYGGYRHIIERKGINLSDFWDDLSPVRHKARQFRNGNQLPIILTDRVVAIACRRGGMLVDPFAGTGTSLISAKKYGMLFVGNDLSRQSIRICHQRLNVS